MNAQLNDQGDTNSPGCLSNTRSHFYTPAYLSRNTFRDAIFHYHAGRRSLPTTSTGGGTVGSTAVGCDNANYLSETKPDDGTQITAGETFTKGMVVAEHRNLHLESGYSFAFITGDQMGGKDIVLSKDADFTDPGHSQTFIVKLQAPATAGEYKGYWQMKNATGTAFGSRVWVDIVVK